MLILFGERSLRHTMSNYVCHFHTERITKDKDDVILFPAPADRVGEATGEVRTRERLGGRLDFTIAMPHEDFDATGKP
jgi:hypothetical protein